MRRCVMYESKSVMINATIKTVTATHSTLLLGATMLNMLVCHRGNMELQVLH